MNETEAVTGYLSAVGLESWVVQVFVVVFVTAAAALVAKRLVSKLHAAFTRTRSVWDESLVEALDAPLRALLWISGIAFAIEIIQIEAGAAIFEAVAPIRDVGIVATFAWFAVRFIRIAEGNFIADKQAKGETFDRATLDAAVKLLRLSVLITAFLVALQTLGFSISGVLAFGGIGGIAVGFAAKDLLANFFGGLMIHLDRPFAVGDWVRSPDREIEGTVERIGWRQTLIRTFDTRPLYIPNSALHHRDHRPPRRRDRVPDLHRAPRRRPAGRGAAAVRRRRSKGRSVAPRGASRTGAVALPALPGAAPRAYHRRRRSRPTPCSGRSIARSRRHTPRSSANPSPGPRPSRHPNP